MLCNCDPFLESESPSAKRLNQEPALTPAAKRVLNLLSRRMGYLMEIYELKNGIVCSGTWKEGRMDGLGCVYLRGCYIQGEWLNDKLKGCGLMIQDNGAYFQGKFENGIAIGKGIYACQSYKYEGMFRMNERHGKGVETTRYYRFEGMFVEGSRRSGKMEWGVDGQIWSYEGEFLNNLYHGKGVLRCPDGIYEGIFVKGTLIKGVTTLAGQMISI